MHPALSVIFLPLHPVLATDMLIWLVIHAALTGDAQPLVGWIGFTLPSA